MLGNLTIEEMEKRSGVEFPEELKTYMACRHQEQAQDIKPGKWHCFDIPFTLMCGDRATATEIYRHLQPLSSRFDKKLQIAIPNPANN